ncbi:hypothetical protein ACOSZH_24660 [Priestia megaterium]|uniref:hypothetical protein n=1 Tax=Priestia megaterium TaxID=1404 RepID=UPI003BA122CF
MYFFDIKRLENITKEYFDLIEDYFGTLYTPGVDKHFQAEKLRILETAAQAILVSIEDLEKDLQEFWEKNSAEIISLVENADIFKVLYTGNPSPLEGVNFIKKTALYLDTLLIEDPISFLLNTKKVTTDKAYLNQLVKHTFNLLDMKKLFFGEGSIPLLIIFPSIITQEIRTSLKETTDNSGDNYFSLLFERDFTDFNDVWEYLGSIESSEQLIKDIKDPRILFFNESKMLERFDQMHSDINETFRGRNLTVGRTLALKTYGQFMNLGTHVFQSQYLSSQIVFNRKDHWDLYKWDINQAHQGKPDVDNIMLHALQTQEFRWLENIDMDKFYLLRNEDEIKIVREALRSNIYQTLNGINEDNIKKQASINLESVLHEHSRKLEELSKELKKKLSIDMLALVGGVVSSIPTSFALVPVIGVASTVYGAYDLFTGTKKAIAEKKKANKSLMGVLIDAKQRSI